ncbi:hypothetical protein [Mycobacterium paragordonae]|uniref:hypothetical protein n=1 Tax=Mycobacterium paragordonae TaxID=1389713 RepID=UPI0019801EA7
MMLVAAGGSGCAAMPDTAGPLVVKQDDRVLRRFNMQQLRDLPQVDVQTPQSHGAQVQRGPSVRSILGAAGVAHVDRLRVEGRDPGQTLDAQELADDVILDLTKRNTLKLTGARLPRDRWVRDVTVLVVIS